MEFSFFFNKVKCETKLAAFDNPKPFLYVVRYLHIDCIIDKLVISIIRQ
jgi:hypothetical protein